MLIGIPLAHIDDCLVLARSAGRVALWAARVMMDTLFWLSTAARWQSLGARLVAKRRRKSWKAFCKHMFMNRIAIEVAAKNGREMMLQFKKMQKQQLHHKYVQQERHFDTLVHFVSYMIEVEMLRRGLWISV